MPRTVLIAGLGSIGAKHLASVRAVAPEARVVVLRRPDSAPAEMPAGALEVRSLDAALAEAPDAAIVAGPATAHLAVAMPLAEAGVPLLVEKPIAAAPDGVADLIAVCRAQGIVLQTGYCLRFERALRALRAALAAGRAGTVRAFDADVGQYLPDWRPGRDYRETVSARADLGGGVLRELSHEIDLVRWMLGEVTAVASAALSHSGELDIDGELEDTADLELETAGGVTASVHMDMLRRTPRRALRIEGTEGTLVWDGIARTAELRPAGGGDAERLALDDDGGDDMLAAQARAFFAAIETGAPPEVGGEDGLRVLEIIEAARLSAAEGRKVTL